MKSKINILSVIFIQFFALIFFVDSINAHQPFGINDKSEENYIELSDATVSHAFYGEFIEKNEEMIIKFQMKEGDTFDFSLLIPNLEPENLIEPDQLPYLIVNGKNYFPNKNSSFYEPYSRMDLIRIIAEKQNIRTNSNITVQVISRGNSRYVFSIGYKEIFNNTYAFGNVRRFSMDDLNEWYNRLYTPEAIDEDNNFLIIIVILFFTTILLSLIFYFRQDILEKLNSNH
ncbi:MAG: hypothetical protein CL893_00395 [Dehalococcoidia bacterium]|nr:hypothetical protein [Dehalococcoidia bacterium]